MRIKFKFFCILLFFNIFNNLFSYEIIRDPVFENYFIDVSNDLKLEKVDVFLIKNVSANAFVIGNNIYLTTGLLELINEEETLKAIYLHEYGHIINNHFQSKKININQSNDIGTFYNLFSLGLAVFAGNANIGIGSSLTLNTSLINEMSKHSVNFEIEADNFMIDHIKKNKINTLELISFLNEVSNSTGYFRTHPKSEDRIISLKQLNYPKLENSLEFEWIKSKYSNNSNNESFNIFFKNLDKGLFDQKEKIDKISEEIIFYEVFKKGILVNDWNEKFRTLISINSNSFLKIEYINYLLESNNYDEYHIIEELKFNKKLMKEFFYYYIYGKYYSKINSINLSNFYFCQFYKSINSTNKADFFCEKYDIKDIPTLDKSYALFK